MYLKKYKNLLNSGRRSNKDPKDSQIMTLPGVDQNIADDSKKSSDKSNMYSTKVYPAYIRDLPPCMLEESNGGGW